MKGTLKAAACAAIAALLASCAGGGTNGTLPATPSGGSNTTSSTQSIPRVAMGSDGHAIAFTYNVQTERSGLVTSGNAPSAGPARTPMSMITGLMTWHNGPVQSAPKLYIDEWGNWGSTGDPSGLASYYSNFVNAIGGSSWLSTVTQYCTGTATPCVGNAGSIYGGVWNDTANAIPTKTLNSRSYQNAIAAEAQKAAAHFNDYSVNASYIILIPHAVAVYQFAGNYGGLNGYCAWHSSTSTTKGTIAYTNFPYIPDAGASCGAASVTTSNLDGVSIVGGHEQAETETDPQPNTGWLDSSNNEIGDKCAWYQLANTSFGTAGSFPTQPLWSNSANNCVQ